MDSDLTKFHLDVEDHLNKIKDVENEISLLFMMVKYDMQLLEYLLKTKIDTSIFRKRSIEQRVNLFIKEYGKLIDDVLSQPNHLVKQKIEIFYRREQY